MSSPQRLVLLDADVISNFYVAHGLEALLSFWPGMIGVAAEVKRELAKWPSEGAKVIQVLDRSIGSNSLTICYLEAPEFALYATLRQRLGSGEAASIAIAAHRRLLVATDDRVAQRLACQHISSSEVYGSEDLLRLAMARGLVTKAEAQQLWARMGIQDPNRGI